MIADPVLRPTSPAPADAAPPLYRSADEVVVRAPLLPIAAYRSLRQRAGRTDEATEPVGVTSKGLDRLLADADVQTALAVASPSLFGALRRAAAPGAPRDRARAADRALRYVIRMATRPTPYGLCAGVGLARLADATELRLTDAGTPRTRPDMGWLLDWVFTLERQPAIRRALRLVAHPEAEVVAGRVVLAARAPGATAGPGAVSLRATAVVVEALAAAHQPVAYGDLVARLRASRPAVAVEKIEALVDELWSHTLLLSDLRPPLTCADPAAHVASVLAASAAHEAAAAFDALRTAIAGWDGAPRRAPDGYLALAGQARALHPSDGAVLQTDLTLGLDGGRIHRSVAAEAARAAELLLRLSPWPGGAPGLSGYRGAFLERYGDARMVPLLELLDPERGLGEPRGFGGHGASALAPERAAERHATLLHLAATAIRTGQRAVELDDTLLAKLSTCDPRAMRLPPTLDINVFVAARSAEAIDQGAFAIGVGPNLGASAGGRNLGRFAAALGPRGTALLRSVAAAEVADRPDAVHAEVVFLPAQTRSANVAVRPAVYDHEIAVGTTPGVPGEGAIPVGELVVGVRDGRFVVRWPAADAEVVAHAGHMLNHHTASPAVRFLLDVADEGRVLFSSFDWGPAERLPYLPRVVAGRSVLRPARWLLGPADARADDATAFDVDLAAWRTRWGVPHLVCLTVADNRLVLDTRDARQRDVLRAELAGAPADTPLVLTEVWPSPADHWLRGPRGAHVVELSVTLLRTPETHLDRPAPPAAMRSRDAGATARRDGEAPASALPSRASNGPIARMERLRPPGSEWLFVKLYGRPGEHDDLIGGPLREMASGAVALGLAEAWYVVRYADPEPHLRVRFRGQPLGLLGHLLPHVCAWADGLVAEGRLGRFAIDTYDREVERYGGAEGMPLAEALFGHDSVAVAELLQALTRAKATADARLVLAVASLDDLVASIVDDDGAVATIAARLAPERRTTGDAYRARKAELASALRPAPGAPEGAEWWRPVLARRRQALTEVGIALRRLDASGALTSPLPVVAESIAHMHLNRLIGGDAATERLVYGLWSRAREAQRRRSSPA